MSTRAFDRRASNPFAILKSSSSSVLWPDTSSSFCARSISPLKLYGVGYCEMAQVHDSSAGVSDSGSYGWREASHPYKYMQGNALNKSATTVGSLQDAPNGDDLAVSIGDEHSWEIVGYRGIWQVTSVKVEKSHALLIMLR